MADNRRFLGDPDAEHDTMFDEHFVPLEILGEIRRNCSSIVFGAKGSGKSALRRALTEIYRDDYLLTDTVNLNSLSFSQVHKALADLRDTSNVEMTRLATNVWRNVLAIYCLDAVQKSPSAPDKLKSDIHEWLVEEGVVELDSDANTRLLGFIERIFARVRELAVDDAETFLPLTPRQTSLLDRFPYDEVMRTLLIRSTKWIGPNGRKALICVDGFDSIVDHTEESRSAIFAGLIDAIQKHEKDTLLSASFCFKAFLPTELTDTAVTKLWDFDKFMSYTHRVHWSVAEIQEFVRIRLDRYTRRKHSKDFGVVWNDFMPATVENLRYSVDESTFGYILRHTFYRPRQVLYHLQRIFDEWERKSSAFKVDKSFIPPVVAATNLRLAESMVAQLNIKHNGIDTFLRSWAGRTNTTSAETIRKRIANFLGVEEFDDQNRLINEFYRAGIFGVAVYGQGPKDLLGFRFSFVEDLNVDSVHASLRSNSVLALNPMLNEYCQCRPSKIGPVIPIDR